MGSEEKFLQADDWMGFIRIKASIMRKRVHRCRVVSCSSGLVERESSARVSLLVPLVDFYREKETDEDTKRRERRMYVVRT
jgi:hypothetical protein